MSLDWSTIFMLVGFSLAAYSVIANDSIQTLGTFLESNKNIKWWKLATAASVIAVIVITYSWIVNSGDISWGRLMTKGIPLPEAFTIWHAIAPLGLLLLTRYGIPASTSLLILSVFATSSTITKMVSKSAMGYVIAFFAAYIIWFIVIGLYEKFVTKNKHKSFYKSYEKNINRTYLQWISTGYLWSVWLMHDMANIAVYLPRQMDVGYLIFTLVLIVGGLFFIFWRKGGQIQAVVSSKSGVEFIAAATMIDFVYACILLYFKEINSIPMSTTWVFVGLLAGREIALTHYKNHGKKLRNAFPLVLTDFAKIMFGLVISVGLAYAVGAISGW